MLSLIRTFYEKLITACILLTLLLFIIGGASLGGGLGGGGFIGFIVGLIVGLIFIVMTFGFLAVILDVAKDIKYIRENLESKNNSTVSQN